MLVIEDQNSFVPHFDMILRTTRRRTREEE
jgi:hypothetical protein